jgi:phosphoglycolate phosphatase-like HAD superfamily hydrolase
VFDCFIFDVDGTLLDSREANETALSRVLLEKKGIRVSREELAPEFGKAGHLTLSGFGFGTEDIPAGLVQWQAYIDLCEVSLYEGILEALAALKAAGKYLGIVTSRRHDELDRDLVRLGLDRLIDRAICADDTLRHKPDPEPLFKFFEGSPVPGRSSLYIGDTDFDARCAASSGTAFALAGWGAVPGALDGEAAGLPCQFRFRHPREILELASKGRLDQVGSLAG